jgi:hypothetical protein
MSDISISVRGITAIAIPIVTIFMIKVIRDVAFKWIEERRQHDMRAPEQSDNLCKEISQLPDMLVHSSSEPIIKIIDNYTKK